LEALREIASWLLIVPGAVFCAIGGLGLLRLPEFYSRMHGAGVTDTLGAALILVGLMLQPADWTVTVKLASILLFLFVTGPTAAHALIHAAYTSGHEPELADDAAVPPEVAQP
jgi:multicomponent Na+:H+ antiporter subunit G